MAKLQHKNKKHWPILPKVPITRDKVLVFISSSEMRLGWYGCTMRFMCSRPVFTLSFSLPAFTPYPLFQWYLQSKEILLSQDEMLKLSI
jgi:hypothetical protein